MTAKKILKKVGIICLFVLGDILALVLLFLGGLNLAKFAIYSDYYSIETNVCKNPGLSDGFVCQGICADEESDKILVSGYMKDDSPSRIYVTDKSNDSYYVTVKYEGGKDYTGHAGGIAISGDHAYIASGEKLLAVPLASILAAKNGDTVTITKKIPVNNQASFVYARGEYVYVGEFHDGGKYVTEHPYDTPDGKYYAIVSRYSASDVANYAEGGDAKLVPQKIYSIRNKVQGICFTPDGKVVLSTSYGLADSVYYVYNEESAVDSGKTLDGAPLYYLCECEKEIKGPAMGEDLEYYEGKVITLTESASDKYIFGKFFFANKIVSLDIEK